MSKVYIYGLYLVFLFLIGCKASDSPEDTPTFGELTVSADETYQPLVESEVSTFESIYTYTNVSVKYKSENEVFNDLMNDSVRLIIVSRELNSEELKQFEKWEIVPKVTKIAYDAIAILGSKDLKDSTYTLRELNSLINADILDPALKQIKVVFDNNNSSTIRFLKEKTGVKELSANCYALNSSEAVLDYVSKQKNCIGVVGVNWVSDRDDTTNLHFLNSVKVLEIR